MECPTARAARAFEDKIEHALLECDHHIEDWGRGLPALWRWLQRHVALEHREQADSGIQGGVLSGQVSQDFAVGGAKLEDVGLPR